MTLSQSHTGLVDIGVNLTSGRFRPDLSSVLQRADRAGVSEMIITGTSVQASREAQVMAASRQGLYATAGVHPHEARHWDTTAETVLRALANEAEVVALGECGLDFNRNFSSPDDQKTCFEAQLALAAELSLPVFLHQRDAHESFMPLLRAYRAHLPGAVVHCFTGTAEELEDYLSLDCHIGVTGWICDARRGEVLRESVKHIPAERLMVETDAPYLTPQTLPEKPTGNRNEPAFLPYVVEQIARCRNEAPEAVAAYTTRTARAFFNLPLIECLSTRQ
ncbi:TatD family hydrolase [Marinimicrobium sp. ARAG 43.8]|uniref:TatD family hydrolase n=1 Tax=Marinimicrobium sp. ARAG 43.8 TaxID=3418719 RepID=UPI003CE9DE9B